VLDQANRFEFELFGEMLARCHGSPPLGFIVPQFSVHEIRVTSGLHKCINNAIVQS
jgi:hypothetical protein